VNWHVDDALVARYVAADLDDARAASIEAHVIACAECRARVAVGMGAQRVDRIWTEVRDSIESPQPRLLEASLRKCGVRDHVARLIAATPSLSGSWFIAITVSLGWAVGAAHAGTKGVLLFLIVAPLIPLAGVMFAYGPRIDPTFEVAIAAPMHGFRLLLLRATSVLSATMLLVGIASIGLPNIGWRAEAWLLPALGVSLVSMALSTWVEPFVAGGIVASGWVLLTSLSPLLRRGVPTLDRIPAFTPSGQAMFAVLIALAFAVLVIRSGRFDRGREA